MKKVIILVGLMSVAGAALALPNVDVSVGGLPFRLIQEAMVEEREMDDMNSRSEDLKFLDRIKRPTRVKLQQPTSEYRGQPVVEPPQMQLKQENGKIMITPAN